MNLSIDTGWRRWRPSTASLLQVATPACGSAALAVLIFDRAGIHHAIIGLVAFALVLAVAAFDARTLLAPNALTYPGTLFAIVGAFTLGRDAGFQASLGGLLSFGVMLGIAIAGRGRMGMGDVKMAALCGAVVGLRFVLPMLVLTFVLGGVIAAGALVSRRRSRADVMAFTPLLAAASIMVTLVSTTYLMR